MFVCKMQTGCLVGGVEGGPFMSELMADSLVSIIIIIIQLRIPLSIIPLKVVLLLSCCTHAELQIYRLVYLKSNYPQKNISFNNALV